MLHQRLGFRGGYRCVFLVLVVLATAVIGTGCRSTPGPAAAPAVSADAWATVDGKTITASDVEKVFRRTRDESQPLSDEETLTAKLGILNDLIVQEILLAKAAALKLEIPQSDLDTAYGNAKKNLTDDAFKQELTRRNLTPEDMRDGLRREMLTQKVIEQEVSSKIAVTDQAVTDFFNANRAQFNVPEEAYHIAQLVITPIRDPQLANGTGDDATTPEQAAAKVRMLMERLKAGALLPRPGGGLLGGSRVGTARWRHGSDPGVETQAGSAGSARRGAEQDTGLGERGQRRRRLHSRPRRRARAGRTA